MSTQVMERSIIHKGKVFIKEDEPNGRAYVLQTGRARSFRTMDGNKVIIAEYGPGTIIGEASLFMEEDAEMGFEALTDISVITITRQDFQTRLQKTDKMVQTVMQHIVHKLGEYSQARQDEAISAAEIDESAFQIVQGMVKNVDADKRRKYELALMPHIDGLVKVMKDLKKS